MFSHFVSYLGIYSTVEDQIRNGRNPTCCLSYTDNTMPADALETLGARASAGMLLILKAGIFCLQH